MNNCIFCQEFHPSYPRGQEGYLTHFPMGKRTLADDGLWNLVPTLGCFTEGYTLLVAKAHRLSLHRATAEEKLAAVRFTESLHELYQRAYGCSYFMFEHGIVDEEGTAPTSVNHVHLHFLPLLPAYESIPSLLAEAALPTYPLSSLDAISSLIEEKEVKSYLLFGVHGQYTLADISKAELPSQYLRAVTYRLATGKEDDGWNWKTHPEEEKMLATFTTLQSAYDGATANAFSKRVRAYEKESSWIRSAAFTEALIPPPFGDGRLLDLACGTGVLAEYAHTLGWQVTALDNCEAMLNEVEKGITKVLASGESLPFADNFFDLAVCRQGLQYMNLPQAAGELVRVSRQEILLLHATVHPDDVATWQSVFTALGYVGKSILASDRIQKTFAAVGGVTLTEDTILYTDERLALPEALLPSLKKALEEKDVFIRRNAIRFTDTLHYRLEWHLLRFHKNEDL